MSICRDVTTDQRGVDVFSKIKEINPRAGVIIATGYLEMDLKEELLRRGAGQFLQKPYEPGEILRKIRDAVEGGRGRE